MTTFAATDATTITAVFTGLATLIAAVGALALSWKAAANAARAADNAATAAMNAAAAKAEAEQLKLTTDVVVAKADTIINETGKIHVLTNDAKSKADAALAVANETIKGLQLLNASLAAGKTPPKAGKPK